jgi:hypothetical protein
VFALASGSIPAARPLLKKEREGNGEREETREGIHARRERLDRWEKEE